MKIENQTTRRLLEQGEERVELHVLPMEEGLFILVALAGSGASPERIKTQGPFSDAGVAEAVALRIAGALAASGFQDCTGSARWEMAAWRRRRDVLRERRPHTPRKAFHPDDVLI